jgi:hypothetical protein
MSWLVGWLEYTVWILCICLCEIQPTKWCHCHRELRTNKMSRGSHPFAVHWLVACPQVSNGQSQPAIVCSHHGFYSRFLSFGIMCSISHHVCSCEYRVIWQVQLASPYTPKVLQTYLMGLDHYSIAPIMVIRCVTELSEGCHVREVSKRSRRAGSY